MKKIKNRFAILIGQVISRRKSLILVILLLASLGLLFTRQLVEIPGGMSAGEHVVASTPIGWQGIAADAFYLPIKLIRSAGFLWFDQGGALVSRLPSVVFGAFAVTALTMIIRAWHGTKISLLAGILFATSAWTLHVSRYASYDSSYLAALPILIATIIWLQRSKNYLTPVIVLLIWGSLLFTPGLVWLVLAALIWQRYSFVDVWQNYRSWRHRLGLVLAAVLSLPLLIYQLSGSLTATATWAGLPANFGSLTDILLRFVNVPVQLFAYGPDSPELWLGRLPILDIVTAGLTLIGVIFYVRKWRAGRSQLLGLYALLATILISLGGPVSFSLIVPLAYLLAGTGIAQLIGEWLKRFPNNPIARSFGILLLIIAVATSVTYNLRHYFVAWPSNQATMGRFDKR